MRIRIVTPVTGDGGTSTGTESMRDLLKAARADDQVDCVQIASGPASIENEFEEAMAVPDTVRKIVEAERDGINAVVIDCMGDPGLYAARQVVNIPVVGPFQAAGHMAATLGHRFAIVTVLPSVIPMFWDRSAVYGFRDRLASVRAVDIPVLRLRQNLHHVIARITGNPPKP